MLPPSFASSLPSSTGLNAAFAPFANHPVPPSLENHIPRPFIFYRIEKKGLRNLNSLLETLGKNISVSKILCDAKVLRFHWQSGTLDKKRGFLERFFPFKTRTHVQVYISLLNYSLFISPSCTLPFNSISFHLPIYKAFLQPTFVSGLSIKTSTLWQRSFTFFTRSSWVTASDSVDSEKFPKDKVFPSTEGVMYSKKLLQELIFRSLVTFPRLWYIYLRYIWIHLVDFWTLKSLIFDSPT